MHVPRTPTVRTVNTAATTTAAAPRSFKDVWLISAGHALTHWYTATFYLLLPLIGKELGRPSWLPVPAFAVKAVAGEFATAVLNGRRVVPAKLRELGYTFREPELATALKTALRSGLASSP